MCSSSCLGFVPAALPGLLVAAWAAWWQQQGTDGAAWGGGQRLRGHVAGGH